MTQPSAAATMPNRTSPWTDAEIDLSPLLRRRVALLGYGNQGRPQALNLRDSGVEVVIGARAESQKRAQAEADEFSVLGMAEAIAGSDVILCLLPDDVMAEAYASSIAPYLKPGQYLGFGHGLVIHAGWVQPAADINVFLVAPKAQGRGVRNKFSEGSGVPGLVAVQQDPSGDTLAVALAYAKAIGCGRAGVFPTTFREETVSDLFSEQTVLCGGLTNLIRAAFDTLVEAGFSREAAYFECLYEVKLIGDLLHERGIAGMREAISSTALFGDLTRGERVIDTHVRENMRAVLEDILCGRFAEEMRAEFQAGRPRMRQKLAQDATHAIEAVHQQMAPFLHKHEGLLKRK